MTRIHMGMYETSRRLQRVVAALEGAHGRTLSSLELILEARVVSASAAISELRKQGFSIETERVDRPGLTPLYHYRLLGWPGRLIRVACGWCRRVLHEAPGPTSTGICEECRRKALPQ